MNYAYSLLPSGARRPEYVKGHPVAPRRLLRLAQLVGGLALVVFLFSWVRNYRRSGHWDPPPIRWEGGRVKEPKEPSYKWLKEWERTEIK